MKAARDVPEPDPIGRRDMSLRPPAPTGDALIDEVRTMKYELSARFDHDLEKLGAYLKAVQEELAQREPQRVIRLKNVSE